MCAHVKISQLLNKSANKPSTSCQPYWYCQTCYKVVTIKNIATTLCYQPCNIHVMTVSDLLEQPCNKSDNAISLLQLVNNLFQTCYNKLGTSSTKTTCWQLVNRLVTTCLQTCNWSLYHITYLDMVTTFIPQTNIASV